MKHSIFFLTLFAFTLLSTSCEQQLKPSPTGLSGIWISNDYWCEDINNKITEEVTIVQDSNFNLIATKVTGDNCVPAKTITFKGQLTRDIECTGGWPNKPASINFSSRILIDSSDKFSVCNLSFVRKQP